MSLLTSAWESHNVAQSLHKQVQRMLEAAMAARLPIGVTIDLSRQRGMPEYLIGAKTFHGHDHGTRLFRIESAVSVEFTMTHPELAAWSCMATPISEKTGKDMSGATHGANSRAMKGMCRIGGHLMPGYAYGYADNHEDAPEAIFAKALQALADFASMSTTAPDPASPAQ